MKRFMSWPLLCALVTFISCHFAWATIPLYQNNAPVYYNNANNPAPNLDTRAFDNESIFSVDFNSAFSINSFNILNPGTEFYQTMNTLYYTNNGIMAADTGFYFDDYTTNILADQIAGTFYNPGSVSCGSVTLTYGTNQTITIGNAGKFIAWATNIINPGAVTIGSGGSMQFSGQNVDLSRSVLSVSSGVFVNTFGNISAVEGGVSPNFAGLGVDTNQDWNPVNALTTTYAYSTQPFTNSLLYFLSLFRPISYFNAVTNNGGSNVIYRSVFIENDNPSIVTNMVYFGQDPIQNYTVGEGDATVEFAGVYTNPATGTFKTNYFYVNNDYVAGAATNAFINYLGIPNNYQFTSTTTNPVLNGISPTLAGFQNIFPDAIITNAPYSYLNGQLVATSVSTNTLVHTNVSALPGRIEITGSNDLNLTLSSISGANYLSVVATNQFDGSSGAQISVPYSDFHIGVTNGNFVLTNLVASVIPIWNGSLVLWSTRFITVDTTTGVTNDYRVLLIDANLNPVTLPQVQNLSINTTNLFISDKINVYNSLSSSAQNLTLTTNGYGNGAASPDGELNVSMPTFSWATAFPNLMNVTNNGEINIGNSYQAMNAFSNSVTAIPTVPEATAGGTLSEIPGRSNVKLNDSVTVGTNVYVFVNTLTNKLSGQVKIATSFDASLSNLVSAINQAGGSGVTYSTNTLQNQYVYASFVVNHAFNLTSVYPGSVGNSVATTTTSTNITWNGNVTLVGGADYLAGSTNIASTSIPYGNFINSGLLLAPSTSIWATNIVNSGTMISDGGVLNLQADDITLTNGVVSASGSLAINADDLLVSNAVLQASNGLTLAVSDLLTDFVPVGAGIVTNGSTLIVGGALSSGLNLPVKPAMSGLLGTTVYSQAPFNRNVVNTWAGQDYGASPAGYSNNAAIGRLILDAQQNGLFTFAGTGTSNAVYVDYLEFRDWATNFSNGNPLALTNTPNMTIYYAQAVVNGQSIAEILDGYNNGHLRWVPAYAGHFSSTNMYYAGQTNVINIALAQSPTISSSGTGIPNSGTSEPVFVSGQVNFTATATNKPVPQVKLVWNTIPYATNSILYTTNLVSPEWLTLTNFVTPGPVGAVPYPPVTNMVFDAISGTTGQRYYRVQINPNVTYYYGE